MSNHKKEILPTLVSLAIAGCVIAGGLWFAGNFFKQKKSVDRTSSPNSSPSPSPNINVEDRISFGDKMLIKQEEVNQTSPEFQAAKQRGITAMAQGNYQQAIQEFETAIGKYRNAPETLIYLNNARIGDKKSYAIAVVPPIDPSVNYNIDSALTILRGIAQAQDEVNQSGGINGVPLKVIIANDDDDAKIAKQIAAALAKDSQILGAIGHYSSGTTLAAKDVYDAEKLTVISSTSTAVKITNSSPFLFRTVPSDYAAARKLADYMCKTLKKKNASVFYSPESAYSQSLKDEFATALGAECGKVVDEQILSKSSVGFDAYKGVKQAIDRGAEVIMLAAPDDRLDEAAQVIQNNNKRLSLLGGDALYHNKILKNGLDEATGMVLAVAWHINSNPNSKFVQNSRQLWSADVDWNTAMTYNAAEAFIEALRRNNNPTRVSIKDTLAATDFSAPGVSDRIQFLPSGDSNTPVQLVEIRAVENSRSLTGYDFVPIK
ncbi:hypothetical protein BCD67_10520 [Oscillatoriales cyanobacterium USR001]|nr:hypothetical protein BCD67_10520 [Oscillatoriales cyanobacterium USR001]